MKFGKKDQLEEEGYEEGADMLEDEPEMPEDMAEGEFAEDMEEEGEEEGEEGITAEFESPLDALGAALDEHGANPEALMDWFQEYGYELVSIVEDEIEDGPGGPPDLVGLRNTVVERLGPMLGGQK